MRRRLQQSLILSNATTLIWDSLRCLSLMFLMVWLIARALSLGNGY